MNKILVQIYLPAAGRSFDVFIPLQLRVFEATALAACAIGKLTAGSFIPDEGVLLCDRATGEILNSGATVSEAGLHNGSELIMM